jgi:hypothetical protein
VNLFGGFTSGVTASDLLYAVYQYFNNGGRQAYIVRVFDGNEVAATVDLLDREPTAEGPPATEPQATITIDASSVGAWGNSIAVLVSTAADVDRFHITVYYGGTAAANVVERWTDLSMDPLDARYVENVVNSPTRGSVYISVTDLGLDGVSVHDRTPAQIEVPVSLADGADALAAPVSADYDTALALVDSIGNPVNLNLPGVTTTTLVSKAIGYAEARGDCFVVIDGVTASTVAEQITAAEAYGGSSYGAVYFPRVVIADPASSAPGATRVVPAGGAVLGIYADTDAASGVQKSPAGVGARVVGAVGLEVMLSNSDLDMLNTSQVNAIRSIPGAGVVVFGARTLTTSGKADKYISVRRSLIYVKSELQVLTRFAIFEPNQPLLWQQMENVVTQFLLGFWQGGGLRGSSASDAFYVVCDESNNPPSAVDNGEVHMEVGVALQTPAEFVVIQIGQYSGQGTSSAVEAA